MKRRNTTLIAIFGVLAVVSIMVFGTLEMGESARKDTLDAVHSVSLLYLDELAGRRERVVSHNIGEKVDVIHTVLELMEDKEISTIEDLQSYQSQMKRLFNLEKFAFVDTDGTIYTSLGTQDDIDDYDFDSAGLKEADVSIKDLYGKEKKVVIAVPIDPIIIEDKEMRVCFMEIGMEEMLNGVSLKAQESGETFCNIYTNEGVALSDTVLGGLAMEDNLIEAMHKAVFDKPYSYEQFVDDFSQLKRGVVSFEYDGIKETLSYVPVEGTDWQLTYLIRESVISEKISTISSKTINRSIMQSAASAIVLLSVFAYILLQNKRNAQLQLEKETADAENRVKRQELEQRLALQEKLIEEQKEREQQDRLIDTLASDYWSVYYVDLDKDEGICYQSHEDLPDGFKEGTHFAYLSAFTDYGNKYVTEPYRKEFFDFIQPDAIRKALKDNKVISYTYVIDRHDRESYEMIRFAGVQKEDDDNTINNIGACFTDVDAQTRKNLAQNQALSDALVAAEEANKAKTAFLSNMSHEIRTPMNAIIGLDNIALNDPETPPQTREYLEKIGSSAEHLLSLINDILDMSRIESGRMTLKVEEFSFQNLLKAINTMFAEQCAENGLEYHCHINGQVDDYYIGDDMKLRQVLINILGNAVKFTPEGGKVELKVKRLNQFDKQSTLSFEISDTGIGMNEDFLPHIFDAFAQEDSSSTNRFGSSGLGLAITKNIVEMMNGTIEVRSKKGEGSTFTVTVTLMDCPKQTVEEFEEIAPHEMSVLVIDDDPIACEHARLVLEKAGIAAETVTSGKEALELVKMHHLRREPYRLILVDWKMPEMDGIETTRKIREIVGKESAIIILTAYRWDEVLEEALEAGVDSFISKPLFANALLDEFRSALARKKSLEKKNVHKADLNGRHILLAEDVQINAEIITMLLKSRNMNVDVAENGKIAVKKFEESDPGYYDAVLMDMRMPEMDGLEATRTIRGLDRTDSKVVPIIALTANAFDEDVQRSLQAGLNAHLSKPVEPDLLFETLESLIKDDE